MSSPSKRIVFPLAAFLIPFVVFLFGPYRGSGDTEPAELLPISILETGRLDFDRFYAAAHDLPYAYRRVGGHAVSSYPIAAGLANVPVFTAARIAGVDLYANREILSHLTADLLASLSVLFLFLAIRRLGRSEGEALVFALVFAFATEVWAVASRGLWQHTPSLLFLCVSFRLLLSSGGRRVALSGLTLGLGVVSRPTDVLIAAPAAAFVLSRRREGFPKFLAWAAAPAAAVSIYSWALLGTPFAFGQLYRSGGFTGRLLPGLAGILASPSRGLFVFSPVLFAAIPGLWSAVRSRSRSDEAALLLWLATGAGGVLLLFSSWGMWWGGASFGYRIVLDVVPVLVLLAAFPERPPWRRAVPVRTAFAVLLAASVFVEILGVAAYPTRFDEGLDLEPARLWRVRDSEIVLAARKLFGGEDAPASRDVPAVWWNAAANDDTVPGWVDASPGGRTIRGPLVLSGWAKSSGGEVEVAVVFDDGRVARPERFPRPDVATALPDLGDASRAGFRATFPPPKGLEERAFCVEMRDPRGRVRRLGPIQFHWGA